MKSRLFSDGRYGQTNFHSNPTKNAPKCIIFILKILKFFSGEGTPPPRTPPLILAPSVLDGTPQKKSLDRGSKPTCYVRRRRAAPWQSAAAARRGADFGGGGVRIFPAAAARRGV
jgi:hypothetical protein